MRTLICLALVFSCLVGLAYAQTVYVGPQGQPLGQSYQSGNQTIYMGPQGQPLGSSYNYGSSCDPQPCNPYGQPVVILPRQPTAYESAVKGAQQMNQLFIQQEQLNLMRQERQRRQRELQP